MGADTTFDDILEIGRITAPYPASLLHIGLKSPVDVYNYIKRMHDGESDWRVVLVVGAGYGLDDRLHKLLLKSVAIGGAVWGGLFDEKTGLFHGGERNAGKIRVSLNQNGLKRREQLREASGPANQSLTAGATEALDSNISTEVADIGQMDGSAPLVVLVDARNEPLSVLTPPENEDTPVVDVFSLVESEHNANGLELSALELSPGLNETSAVDLVEAGGDETKNSSILDDGLSEEPTSLGDNGYNENASTEAHANFLPDVNEINLANQYKTDNTEINAVVQEQTEELVFVAEGNFSLDATERDGVENQNTGLGEEEYGAFRADSGDAMSQNDADGLGYSENTTLVCDEAPLCFGDSYVSVIESVVLIESGFAGAGSYDVMSSDNFGKDHSMVSNIGDESNQFESAETHLGEYVSECAVAVGGPLDNGVRSIELMVTLCDAGINSIANECAAVGLAEEKKGAEIAAVAVLENSAAAEIGAFIGQEPSGVDASDASDAGDEWPYIYGFGGFGGFSGNGFFGIPLTDDVDSLVFDSKDVQLDAVVGGGPSCSAGAVVDHLAVAECDESAAPSPPVGDRNLIDLDVCATTNIDSGGVDIVAQAVVNGDDALIGVNEPVNEIGLPSLDDGHTAVSFINESMILNIPNGDRLIERTAVSARSFVVQDKIDAPVAPVAAEVKPESALQQPDIESGLTELQNIVKHSLKVTEESWARKKYGHQVIGKAKQVVGRKRMSRYVPGRKSDRLGVASASPSLPVESPLAAISDDEMMTTSLGDAVSDSIEKAQTIWNGDVLDGVSVIDVTHNSAPVAERAKTYHYLGRVRSGQMLTHAGDVVVEGAVGSCGEVVAGGDVHVYGVAGGRLMAGVGGDVTACIYVQAFDAELVSIAGAFTVFEDVPDDLRGRSVRISLVGGDLQFEPIRSLYKAT